MIRIVKSTVMERAHWAPSWRKIRPYRGLSMVLIGMGLWGCSDFVEVDPPKHILVAETVFNDPATVASAMAHIFYGMREQGMVSGTFGLTTALGIYGDELDYYGFDAARTQLYQHSVLASNNTISGWWSNAYALIYGANDIIKGVEGSSALSGTERNRFMGQALFVRAYMHSLLVSVFGDVPYITTTDYLENNVVARLPREEVHSLIIKDLERAVGLLEEVGDLSEERVLPDHHAAKALLARIYLYDGDWDRAAAMASELIDHFDLETDLDQVFLKESRETIWQLKPGETPANTHIANELVIVSIQGQTYALTDSLMEAFETNDLRKALWTDSISNADGTLTLYFAHKYRARFTETQSLEHDIVLRLAEQYLIRAEARARSGNMEGARQDLDVLRQRAGLEGTGAVGESGLVDAILRERRVELFAEHGHRWFDLRRTANAGSVLGALKPGWRPTDIVLPIPETELETNPNLAPQNEGY